MTKTKKKVLNKARVLNTLKAGKGVTRKTAEKMGVANLRATIFDLRKNDGYDKNILTNIVRTKNEKFVKYTWK